MSRKKTTEIRVVYLRKRKVYVDLIRIAELGSLEVSAVKLGSKFTLGLERMCLTSEAVLL